MIIIISMLLLIYLIKMVNFHSYIKLPKGILVKLFNWIAWSTWAEMETCATTSQIRSQACHEANLHKHTFIE
jgi:hypothetical protein